MNGVKALIAQQGQGQSMGGKGNVLGGLGADSGTTNTSQAPSNAMVVRLIILAVFADLFCLKWKQDASQ